MDHFEKPSSPSVPYILIFSYSSSLRLSAVYSSVSMVATVIFLNILPCVSLAVLNKERFH